MVSVLDPQPARQGPEDDSLVAESEAEPVTDEPESEDKQPEDEQPDDHQEDSQESTRGAGKLNWVADPKEALRRFMAIPQTRTVDLRVRNRC